MRIRFLEKRKPGEKWEEEAQFGKVLRSRAGKRPESARGRWPAACYSW
jgi:hypothetical protein